MSSCAKALVHRLWLSLAVLLVAAPAAATVLVPDVVLRGEAPHRALREGESFAIPVDIYVREGAVVQEVGLRTDLPSSALRFEPELALQRQAPPEGYRHERRVLRGTLEPGLDRVRLQVVADGVVYEEAFGLRGFGDPVAEEEPVALGREAVERLDPNAFTRPDPVPTGFPTAEPGLAKAARPVTVSGRIVLRLPGEFVNRGVDGATVSFMQVRGLLDDLELASTTTDVNGDFTINTSLDGTPDVYVKVRAVNSAANVGTDFFFTTYGRNTPVFRSYAGSSLDIGTRIFDSDMNHALWLLTTFTRQQRWFDLLGYPLPAVNCRWIDDVIQSSCYLPIAGMEGIHLRSSATWNSRTVLHEYGHHFVHASPANEVWPPYYLNEICDPSHCLDCPENEAVAWSEGLPHFLQQEFNAHHRGFYGWSMPNGATFEGLRTCDETGNFGEAPASTEGFFAAFLNDLVDARADDSPLAPGVFEDSRLFVNDILTVATTYEFSNSLDFVTNMRAYLSSPGFTDRDRREFWAAAAVNGFAADTVAPTAPLVSSPTHPIGVEAPSSVPVIVASNSTDAVSGLAWYRIDIGAAPGAPGPGAVQIDAEVGSLVWPTPLAQGVYHVNVVAVDRAGNVSTTTSYGPIEVGPGGEVDLTTFLPGLWENTIVVRHDTAATATAAGDEAQLIAGQDIWVSASTRNGSPFSATTPSFRHRVVIDDEGLGTVAFPSGVMLAGEEFPVLNVGPVQLSGGRHYVRIDLDDLRSVDESNESNRFGRDIVVRPDLIAPGAWQGPFPSPPSPRTAARLVDQPFPAVAGHRFAPQNQFAAFVMLTVESEENYFLNLHPISTGTDNGFETPIASSSGASGQMRSFIVNKSALGAASFDVGVRLSARYGDGDYSVQHVSSQVATPGDDLTVNFGFGDVIELVEFTFNVLETGPFSVQFEGSFDPLDPNPGVQVYWIESTTGVVRPLVDPAVAAFVDELSGDVQVTQSGTYCLALVRDVRSGQVGLPATITIRTDVASLPDLAALREADFWPLPFLPSIEPIPSGDVPLPTELVGGGFDTYLNFWVVNTGQLGASNVTVSADLDGVVGQQFFFGEVSVDAKSATPFYGQFPVFVPGGRHAMVLTIDPFGQVAERNEANNQFAVQFGWKGPDLVPFSNVQMAAPPDPEAGFELAEFFTAPASGPDGEDPPVQNVNSWYPNSDGFRLPAVLPRSTSGNWTAVATMPTANGNVDVRLHEVLPPAEAYGPTLVSSTWGLGETDFVLVDRNVAGNGAFDVSVIDAGSPDTYTLVQIDSQDLGVVAPGGNVFGQYGMDGGGFLSLYDATLAPGTYTVSLKPQSNDADMGLSVFFPATGLDLPFHSKDDGRDRQPMAYDAPAGDADAVQFEVRPGEEGNFCFAVWKVEAAGMNANQDYTIEIDFQPAAPECVQIDGVAEQAYGAAKAVQTVQTGFGDANLGLVDEANGSELDQAFARVCDGTLYLTLTGNLESNYNDLEIFVDSRPGGQNRLRGDNPVVAVGADPNRMGDDGSGNGFTFDVGFEADWWFSVQGGTGEAFDGAPYRLLAYQAELLDVGGGAGSFLGATVPGSRGILSRAGGGTGSDVRVTIDNSNVAGVGAGTGSASGAGVVTGVEFAIPLSAIGSPTDCIRVVAFVNGSTHDFVSNQFLPPLPVGTGNPGEPRNVDLGSFAGNQYFVVCQDQSTGTGDDVPVVDARRTVLHAPAPNPFNPRTTLSFTLPRESAVELVLYDVAGRRVRSLARGETFAAGRHEVIWEGLDDHGRQVASGSYLLRMVAGGEQQVQRLTLLK